MQQANRSVAVLAALLGCMWLAAGPVEAAAADPQQSDSGQQGQPQELQAEFERICGQTGHAAALSGQQLQELIQASGALLERLEQDSSPRARNYLFRLSKCRDFYQFMLDYRESE